MKKRKKKEKKKLRTKKNYILTIMLIFMSRFSSREMLLTYTKCKVAYILAQIGQYVEKDRHKR
jgi:hypothetical protein